MRRDRIRIDIFMPKEHNTLILDKLYNPRTRITQARQANFHINTLIHLPLIIQLTI